MRTPTTQHGRGDHRCVRKFADFIQKPLHRATCEDARTVHLYLIEERKLAYSSFNQAV